MNSTQIIGHIMAATGKLVPEIAKEYGFSKVSFYSAINGNTRSVPIRGIITSITGLTEDELWPEEQTENCEIINKTVTEPREQQNA